MISKLEIYGIVLAGLIACVIAAYLKGHHSGYTEAQNAAAQEVLKANQRTDLLNEQLSTVRDDSAAALALQGKIHSDQLSSALAHVKPVLVRVGADSGRVLQTPAAAGHPAAPGQPDVPVSAVIDIAPAEYMLAAECQQDRDALDSYVGFYANLLKRTAAQ